MLLLVIILPLAFMLGSVVSLPSPHVFNPKRIGAGENPALSLYIAQVSRDLEVKQTWHKEIHGSTFPCIPFCLRINTDFITCWCTMLVQLQDCEASLFVRRCQRFKIPTPVDDQANFIRPIGIE